MPQGRWRSGRFGSERPILNAAARAGSVRRATPRSTLRVCKVEGGATAETAPGNNGLTAGEKCLGFVITVDGQNPLRGTDPTIPYCLPVKDPANALWGYQDWLKYNYEHAAGTLQMGMVKADVAKVVAHVDGLAPVTAETIPAPGLPQQAFYFLPIAKDNGFGVTFDEYDAHGVKIGTFDNSTPKPYGK